MPHAQTPKPLTYEDVVRTLNDQGAKDDINSACAKLAQAMTAMTKKFDEIAKQMHTVDLLRRDVPLKPRWDAMRKDLTELLWQFRSNAGIISNRLKLLSTAVLPMTVRSFDERQTPHNEGLQVLRSYMIISEEHFGLTKALVDRSVQLSSNLMTFLSDFTKLLSRHVVKGQKEMCALSQHLYEFANRIERLQVVTRDTSTADCSHLLFTAARLVLSSGQSAGRSKITRRQVILKDDDVRRAYEQTDRKRNEVAHVQYAAHLQQNPLPTGGAVDCLSTAHTMLCAFLLEELLITESAVDFFLSIVSQLRNDCAEMFQWMMMLVAGKNSNSNQLTGTPMTISCYLETMTTLYAPLANGLDIYVGTPPPPPQ